MMCKRLLRILSKCAYIMQSVTPSTYSDSKCVIFMISRNNDEAISTSDTHEGQLPISYYKAVIFVTSWPNSIPNLRLENVHLILTGGGWVEIAINSENSENFSQARNLHRPPQVSTTQLDPEIFIDPQDYRRFHMEMIDHFTGCHIFFLDPLIGVR